MIIIMSTITVTGVEAGMKGAIEGLEVVEAGVMGQ